MTDYDAFVQAKRRQEVATGHTPGDLNENLFEFQHAIVSWDVRRGRAAIFADTGLGKTLMQLSWADEVASHTGGMVLILAPLAVSEQTIEQGSTFGIEVRRVPNGGTPDAPGDCESRVTHGDDLPVAMWQKYASPIWDDIDQGRTLNKMPARDENDQKHMRPLQLDVIERCIHLWTNPGDLVFSPFTGIGSEGYCAVRMGRKFVGTELKPQYFELACANIDEAMRDTQDGLF